MESRSGEVSGVFLGPEGGAFGLGVPGVGVASEFVHEGEGGEAVGGEGGGDGVVGEGEFEESDAGAFGDAAGGGGDGGADAFVGERVVLGVEGAQGDALGVRGLARADGFEDVVGGGGQVGDGAGLGDVDGAGGVDAGGDRGVEVALLVADHPGVGEVEAEFVGGGEDHAGSGLAPGVMVGEPWVGAVGVVGRGVAGVDEGVGDWVWGSVVGGVEGELGAEGVVARVDVGEGASGAGDAALVGDDDDGEAGALEPGEGFAGSGEGVDVVGVEEVAGGASGPGGVGQVGVAADGVVPVEEDGGAWVRSRHGQG